MVTRPSNAPCVDQTGLRDDLQRLNGWTTIVITAQICGRAASGTCLAGVGNEGFRKMSNASGYAKEQGAETATGVLPGVADQNLSKIRLTKGDFRRVPVFDIKYGGGMVGPYQSAECMSNNMTWPFEHCLRLLLTRNSQNSSILTGPGPSVDCKAQSPKPKLKLCRFQDCTVYK